MAKISGFKRQDRDFEVDQPFGITFTLEGGDHLAIRMDGSDWREAVEIQYPEAMLRMVGATVKGMEMTMEQGVKVLLRTTVGDFEFVLKGSKGRHFVVTMGEGKTVYGVL